MYSEKKYGLVLSGGGGKGAFQIGAWKALKELKITQKIVAVSGSSVGTLNALLFSQGTYEQAMDVWLSVDQDDMLYQPDDTKRKIIEQEFEWLSKQSDLLDKSRLMRCYLTISVLCPSLIPVMNLFAPLKRVFCKDYELNEISLKNLASLFQYGLKEGAFSQDGLLKLIDNFLMISDNFFKIPTYATVCKAGDITTFLSKTNAEYIYLNNKTPIQVREIVLATSALPFIYPKRRIEESEYYDGGWADNTPIKPLYDTGIRDFIVIYLENNNRNKLNKKFKKEEEKFPDANIIRIIPSKKFKDDIVQTITVFKEITHERMQMGYYETLEQLKEIF